MKTPIEVSEIRKGDRIVAKYKVFDAEYEVTYTASGSGQPWRSKKDVDINSEVEHYLLDRPAPAVDLPTEPTLGWLEVSDTGQANFTRIPGRVLGVFKNRKTVVDGGTIGSWSHDLVTAFTPATAVPTSALDELREYMRKFSDGAMLTRSGNQIRDFLAAVDRAGDPR